MTTGPQKEAASMRINVGLAQTCHPDDGNVVALVERFAAEASMHDVALLVFPESLMSRYEAELGDFLAESQPIDGPFTQAIDAIAAKYGMWIVYTMNERNPSGGKPFNTAIVTDDAGMRKGVYRKVHLFDSATTHESDRMAASDELFEPIETPFGTLGMAICYDLRFPEVARVAALAGCDILAYPSAWVSGPGKTEQWETLLRARAIENELFVLGTCRADEGYVGHSAIIGPDGTIHACGDGSEALIIATIDTADLDAMRAAIPVFSHRRPDVYLEGISRENA